jgi:serine/threonine-protein kinase RsbW
MTSDDARHPEVPLHGRLTVAPVSEVVENARSKVVEAMEALEYPRASVFAVRVALEEAMSNAFNHGHKGLPAGTTITLEFDATRERVALAVEDQGPGYVPDAVPDPTLDENLERTSGRGLFLIRAYMTHVSHNARGNRLEMVYERPE